MIESEVIVTTKHGRMPTFMAAPDAEGQHPGIIFYMDAPGIREELRNMARRIAKHGYVVLLPDMYVSPGHSASRHAAARRWDVGRDPRVDEQPVYPVRE